MVDAILLTLAALSVAVCGVSIVLNLNTPLQTGPLPVVGGSALAVVLCLWVIARHLVWR